MHLRLPLTLSNGRHPTAPTGGLTRLFPRPGGALRPARNARPPVANAGFCLPAETRLWFNAGSLPQPEAAVKAKPDCVAGLFRQALNTVRLITDDPEVHLRMLKAKCEMAAGELGVRIGGTVLQHRPATLPYADTNSARTGSRAAH